jgi:hypothetical protein
MRRKTLSNRQRRAMEPIQFLATLEAQSLPVQCTKSDEVEYLLLLQAAALVDANFEATVRERSGASYVPRAVVIGITSAGRVTLAKAAREHPELFPIARTRGSSTRR